jgi:hypothetical protein
MGLSVWKQDEAGPFQTISCAGNSWQEDGRALHRPHEYVRNGTAKLLTLFHPRSGKVRAKGVTSCPNAVLHVWFKTELAQVLAKLPLAPTLEREANRPRRESWQAGLQWPITLSAELPPLRMLLVLDNLAGHKTPEFVLWLFAHGIMPPTRRCQAPGSTCVSQCNELLSGGRWSASIHKQPTRSSAYWRQQ